MVSKVEKQVCEKCGKLCIQHSKGMCVTCYKKYVWKPKLHECKRCKRKLPHHAKGYCAGCYNSLFHLDRTKDYNYKKWHNISPELYRKLTEKCLICGFNNIVELHHLDKNKLNNSEKNLVGLCPNHHKMLHTLKYRDEVIKQLNTLFLQKID